MRQCADGYELVGGRCTDNAGCMTGEWQVVATATGYATGIKECVGRETPQARGLSECSATGLGAQFS